MLASFFYIIKKKKVAKKYVLYPAVPVCFYLNLFNKQYSYSEAYVTTLSRSIYPPSRTQLPHPAIQF